MSVISNMSAVRRVGMVVLSGNSHRELHSLICERLDLPEGRCVVENRANSETVVDIKETVRGKDVYIVQTGSKNVNNDIMEMLVLAYACRTSCARNIIGVIPYLPYCKQSKMRKRGSIVSRLLADMIAKAGFTHLITMDLHHKEIQGFYNFPVDNLRASSFLVQYIKENIKGWRNAVLVAKNPTYVNRASSFSERLHIPFAVVHGETKVAEHDTDDGRNSPPPELNGEHHGSESSMFSYDVSNRMHTFSSSPHPSPRSDLDPAARIYKPDLLPLPALNPKEKPPINIVGEVNGKTAIIVADIIDDVNSFIAVADCLKSEGAGSIYVVATHGLLSLDAPRLLAESCIDEIVVTNTIPHEQQKSLCPKIKTVDVSALFAEAIRRIHNEESMSHLFRHVSLTD